MIYEVIDSIISTMIGYRQIVNLSANTNNLTFGYFNLGDKLMKRTNTNSGFICTGAGSLGELSNCKATVIDEDITISGINIPGNKSVIKFDSFDGDNLGENDFITIDGVTGSKFIRELIYLPAQNEYYAKLDSACDNVVTNATVTKYAPTFTEY